MSDSQDGAQERKSQNQLQMSGSVTRACAQARPPQQNAMFVAHLDREKLRLRKWPLLDSLDGVLGCKKRRSRQERGRVLYAIARVKSRLRNAMYAVPRDKYLIDDYNTT